VSRRFHIIGGLLPNSIGAFAAAAQVVATGASAARRSGAQHVHVR
jgi:hypothetical protein